MPVRRNALKERSVVRAKTQRSTVEIYMLILKKRKNIVKLNLRSGKNLKFVITKTRPFPLKPNSSQKLQTSFHASRRSWTLLMPLTWKVKSTWRRRKVKQTRKSSPILTTITLPIPKRLTHLTSKSDTNVMLFLIKRKRKRRRPRQRPKTRSLWVLMLKFLLARTRPTVWTSLSRSTRSMESSKTSVSMLVTTSWDISSP